MREQSGGDSFSASQILLFTQISKWPPMIFPAITGIVATLLTLDASCSSKDAPTNRICENRLDVAREDDCGKCG